MDWYGETGEGPTDKIRNLLADAFSAPAVSSPFIAFQAVRKSEPSPRSGAGAATSKWGKICKLSPFGATARAGL